MFCLLCGINEIASARSFGSRNDGEVDYDAAGFFDGGRDSEHSADIQEYHTEESMEREDRVPLTEEGEEVIFSCG